MQDITDVVGGADLYKGGQGPWNQAVAEARHTSLIPEVAEILGLAYTEDQKACDKNTVAREAEARPRTEAEIAARFLPKAPVTGNSPFCKYCHTLRHSTTYGMCLKDHTFTCNYVLIQGRCNCEGPRLSKEIAQSSTLTQPEYLERFETVLKEMLVTTRSKNSDYAEAQDAFANFRLIEDVTGGKISTADGIFVRMTDKVKRAASLLSRPNAVKSESLQDTLTDLAVYSVILRIWLDFRGGK